MALKDELYQQIFRFFDNEMDTDELYAFEADLPENEELWDELEVYKQVRSLCASLNEKISAKDQLLIEGKKSNERIWATLANARINWESQYENELKLKYGST